MQLHRVAKLFPEMSTEQFADLVADIEKNGQIEPILTCSGKIADGHHRFKACRKLKIAPQFVRWEDIRPDKDSSLVTYVISKNLRRRHLTTGQRTAIATKALPLFEAEAKAKMKKAGAEGGKASGASRREKTTASKGPAKLQDPSPNPTESQATSKKAPSKKASKKAREQESTARAAKQAGVSPRYVAEAKALFKKVPELEPLVTSGAVDIPLAKKIAALGLKAARAVIRAGKKVGYKKALANFKAKAAEAAPAQASTGEAPAPEFSQRDIVNNLKKATKQATALHDTLTAGRDMAKAVGLLPITGDGMNELSKLTAECAALAAEINGK